MWNGKKKAITFSFDDGITQDARIMEIMSRYGLKATFFINSGAMGVDGSASVSNALGKPISHVRVTESEIRNGYYDDNTVNFEYNERFWLEEYNRGFGYASRGYKNGSIGKGT